MRLAYSALLGNRTSAIGVALTTASGLIFLFLLVLDLVGALQNPYMGIVLFVLLPALFAIGLLLIPSGPMAAAPPGSRRCRAGLAEAGPRRSEHAAGARLLHRRDARQHRDLVGGHLRGGALFRIAELLRPDVPRTDDARVHRARGRARTPRSPASRATSGRAWAATSKASSPASGSCTSSRAGPSTAPFPRPCTTSRR